MRYSYVGACLLALATAGPAFAQADATTEVKPSTEARVPNFLGSTGLLLTPSAYTQGDRRISGFIGGTSDFFAGGIVGGIGSRLEVGLGGFDPDGGDTEFLLNAKYNLLRETNKWPSISVGVIDAFDDISDDASWFVVASKYFTRSELEQRFALKGHVGFGGGVFDEEIFAGAELFFDRSLSGIAEVANSDFNFGARYTSGGFAATLALFDFDHLGGNLSYTVRF